MHGTFEEIKILTTRFCTSCNEEFPATNRYFHKAKNGRFGLTSRCKGCRKKYREENKDMLNIARRKWYQENKDRHKDFILKRKFGITLEEYNQLLEDQNGVCIICGRKERYKHHRNGEIKRLSVDHNHKTGVVRGLVCTDCNAVLGYAHDNPLILFNAIKYLRGSEP